jgi:thymidylate synthase
MIAQVCNLEVGDLIIAIGDAHIYSNHIDQIKEQLSRKPLPLSTIKLNSDISIITEFDMEDIVLENYNSHEAIQAPMAV